MNTIITAEVLELAEEEVYSHPAISVIMPFEPKMSSKKELMRLFNLAIDKVERKLTENYPDEVVMLMLQKLNLVFNSLNFGTHKRSIAVYVSPVFEKIMYLDVPVEQRIMVDESFQLRDLVNCKKAIQKYLVLLLSGKKAGIYSGDTNNLTKIVSGTSWPGFDENNSVGQEPGLLIIPERQKVELDKYLHHIDNTLGIILNTYPLPLFVAGTENIIDRFGKLSIHRKKVIDYMKVNFENPTLPRLKEMLEPYVADWEKVMQKNLLNKLELAGANRKLAVGIKNVWREAMNDNGCLLVLEKNYKYAAENGIIDDIICRAIEPSRKFSCIKNVVDEIIEKVLENGGDVEFVNNSLGGNYNHIAMVQCF